MLNLLKLLVKLFDSSKRMKKAMESSIRTNGKFTGTNNSQNVILSNLDIHKE